MTAPVPEEERGDALPTDLDPPGEHDGELPSPEDAENPDADAQRDEAGTTDGEPSQ